MANENKALTVEGEALDTVNNDTQLSVASVAEPMEISASVTRALADSLAKIAAYVPINYVDNMEPDINAANLNQNEQALMRVTNLMNSAVDVIKDLQSQVTKLNGDFAITKYPGGVIDISGQLTAIVSWIKSNTTIFKRYNYVRANPTDTDGYFGTSSFDIIWNLSSVNYGWLMLRSDNNKSVLFGRLVIGEAKWDIPVFKSDLIKKVSTTLTLSDKGTARIMSANEGVVVGINTTNTNAYCSLISVNNNWYVILKEITNNNPITGQINLDYWYIPAQ